MLPPWGPRVHLSETNGHHNEDSILVPMTVRRAPATNSLHTWVIVRWQSQPLDPYCTIGVSLTWFRLDYNDKTSCDINMSSYWQTKSMHKNNMSDDDILTANVAQKFDAQMFTNKMKEKDIAIHLHIYVRIHVTYITPRWLPIMFTFIVLCFGLDRGNVNHIPNGYFVHLPHCQFVSISLPGQNGRNSQMIFSDAFSWMKNLDQNLTKGCSLGSNWQHWFR